MRTLRVFPRRTEMTPDDEDVRIGLPTFWDEADRVEISVAFTADLPKAEMLYKEWQHVTTNTVVGGPATGEPGGDFTPGQYLKTGMVITSRGCPNRCPHCTVPQREGPGVRELPVTAGYNVLDDNLLACSEDHQRSVFLMLASQPQRPLFTGGLEAARLTDWHTEWFAVLKPARLFFAYDSDDADYDALVEAGRKLAAIGYGIRSHKAMCYVLIGMPRDTKEAAGRRIEMVIRAGFMPYAMLYMDPQGKRRDGWSEFHRAWCRPQVVGPRVTEILSDESAP